MSARTGPRSRVNSRTLVRVVAVGALVVAVVVLAKIVVGGSSGYVVYAQFHDTGGLRSGFKVRIDGAPVGQVASLKLGPHDYAVAKLEIDKSAAPMGADARATVRAADLLGEKYVDLQPGNRQDAVKSGSTIPPTRTGLAVELDDVLNSLDVSTRDALHAFINEQGSAFVGRGGDLAATLAALPSSLDQSKQFLAEFGHDNAALGQLLDESDRVVAAVAAQRGHLGQLVSSASGTLATLAERSGNLGATVARAPATLAALRRALAALQGAATPLGPAARGLAATAPQLTSTLDQLPKFYASAKPTLDVIRQVSPTLQRLGTQGTPVVKQLRPLTTELASFATNFDPVTKLLDQATPDVLGVTEGWARATQARDAGSHVFRFGLTVGADTFTSLLPILGLSPPKPGAKPNTPTNATAPKALTLAPPVAKPQAAKPVAPIAPILPQLTSKPISGVQRLLKYLLK